MKEFKDFQEFYNYGYNLVSNIKSKTNGFLAGERVEYARNNVGRHKITYDVLRFGWSR